MPGIEEFDFVVVGSGPAGCVITHRLSAAGYSVCLLEAGGGDSSPLIHIPAGYIRNVYSKDLTWSFRSEPIPGTDRSLDLPQGRVLGGSSSINGLNYTRGQAADFDDLANRGISGWSWSDVLPFFKRSEYRIGDGGGQTRGRHGELPITDLDWRHPLLDAFFDATEELGIPRNPDYNSGDQAGTGYFQRTIRHGVRFSAAKAFLRPALKTGRVNLKLHAMAQRIHLEQGRAVGVDYRLGGRGGSDFQVRARREVIISAGAVNSPKLLQLSGVGPGDLLRSLGVPVAHERAGVGENYRDHFGVRMVAGIQGVPTINRMVQGLPLLTEILRWVVRRPSLLAVSPSLAHLFWMSRPDLTRPDLMMVFTPASFRAGVVGLLDKTDGMTIGVWPARPESCGYVRAKSADPFDAPSIQPNYLKDETDRATLLGGMRLARDIYSTIAFAPFLSGYFNPGPDLTRDDELLDWALRTGTTVYHMVGSCSMGAKGDPRAVVDGELRVLGIGSLRVADASVLPGVPSGNTNAPSLMVGERAADFILRGAI